MIKKILKKYWVIFLMIALLIPIILNFILIIPAFTNIVGTETDWLEFWGTYLSAIASFVMVFTTWKTLEQNREQLNLMKKQWEDEHRPLLDIYIVKEDFLQKGYTIEILNIGNSPAINIGCTFDDELLKKIEDEKAKDKLNQFIGDVQLSLLPNEARSYQLCTKDTINTNQYEYYICETKTEEANYNSFYTHIKGKDYIHAKLNYKDNRNISYSLDINVSTKNRRNSYLSLNEAITKLGDNIVKTLIDKGNDTKQ